MNISPDLRAILVCPVCHAALVDDASANELVCTTCAVAYPVVDAGSGDIPVMLIDQARKLS